MAMALPQTVVLATMDHPLTRWRQKHRVTQTELAHRCGVTQKSISAYETYVRVPRGQSLARLVQETHLPYEALLFPEQYLRDHPNVLKNRPGPRDPEEGER